MTELEILKWVLGILLGSLGLVSILLVGVGRVLATQKSYGVRLASHSTELVGLASAVIRIERKLDKYLDGFIHNHNRDGDER